MSTFRLKKLDYLSTYMFNSVETRKKVCVYNHCKYYNSKKM